MTLHLNLFIYPGGHHEAAWRHPDSAPERVLDISYYQDLAGKAEAARFDAVSRPVYASVASDSASTK